MTQVYVIIGIIMLACLLVCYIFVKQTVIKRKKEKMRLRRALEKRSQDLVRMLTAFPPNFLPNDLQIFLYRCIIDVFEQLSTLAPEEHEYLENCTRYTSHMETAARSPQTQSQASIQNSSQINELRQHLNYLGRFLQKWLQRGNINAKQYAHYKVLLKNNITKLMIDNYSLSAKYAVDIEKHKLAAHYFMLAKNLITKEGLIASHKGRLLLINQELVKLDEHLKAEAEKQVGFDGIEHKEKDNNHEDENTQKLQQFKEVDEWKKKNVYD
ncbi:MAG: hypothetical protein ACJAUP_001407 [Cellvibrionaceae bacterium]|jgi:hypothetical protein